MPQETVLDFNRITAEVLEKAARKAVENVLSDKLNMGFAERDSVEGLVAHEVRRLINEDAEVAALIRKALVSWIRTQTVKVKPERY